MAGDMPRAEITNGQIAARLYLPNAQDGYYRGTRFDWSGVVYSLTYEGHQYFGQWFEKYDPKLHDAIMGPVEEFLTGDSSPGYDEAKAGETFIRIGVGRVKKGDDKQYQRFGYYEVVDPGKWTVRKGANWIEFEQELSDPSGYAYVYRKKMSLTKGKPELVIAHTLKNTGREVIETSQYNHNFFVMDNSKTGPGTAVVFAFDPKAQKELGGMAEVRGKELVFLKELAPGQSVFTEFAGFGDTAKDYDIRMEHRNIGMGVRIRGDRPLEKVVFWSISTTFCPEPYVKMRIEPGREFKWALHYDFYTMPPAK